MRQIELIEKIKSYDPEVDEGLLGRAYVYAMEAHGSQTRESGDPYFSHPLEVAEILADLKLDAATIITALLHDTIEDTEATLEEVEGLFGKEISGLVDGVTKLTQLELQSSRTKQAENLRKLIVAMSDDIRVLLVKLADRFHNMQTLHFVKSPEKRKRIAEETLEIYAPLAERIGLIKIKDELQDLSFAELHPDARKAILERLEHLRKEEVSLVEEIRKSLADNLKAANVDAQISGREKSPYSIWNKMKKKNVGFEQLSDIMAFRVITDSIGSCYQALGTIHSQYLVIPGRFKDYISTSKSNGYQSLHTTVIGPKQQKIEVQIRTQEMHDYAELGVAAHWLYKQDGEKNTEGRQYQWLRELLEIIENADSPEEFLEHTKMNMYQDQVFCFTPGGDLISLPRGATPVDFAYAIHSKVGDTCTGAKINGRIVPLRTELENGDQIDIIRDKNKFPSPDWEQFVVTGKAKSRIRRFVRQQKRSEYEELGRQMLQSYFRKHGKSVSEKKLEQLLDRYNYAIVDDIYANVGEGSVAPKDIFNQVFVDFHKKEESDEALLIDNLPPQKTETTKVAGISIQGLIPGMAVHLAKCCHPLPGDNITGIIMTGRGVTIHTSDCVTLETFKKEPERWIDVSWGDDEGQSSFVGRLHLTIDNIVGSIGSFTTIIGQNEGDIQNMKIINRTSNYFEVILDLRVASVDKLEQVIAALRASSKIKEVRRVRS